MTGNSGTTSEQSVTSKDPNVTATTITRTELTATSGTDVFSSTGWNTSNTLSLSTDYISFTVTPSSGFSANLTQLSFKVSGSNTAPASLVVAYSTDGFATSTSSSVTTVSATLASQTWNFNDFTATAGTSIAFRFYAYGATSVNGGASATSGSIRFDDIVLSGTVALSSVPEPSSFALLGGLATVGFAAARRRRALA